MGNNYGTIAIVAGGLLDRGFLPKIKKADFVIGVDFGAWWLIEQGRAPDMAIGDFDSVDAKQFSVIKLKVRKVITFKKEKDATDLEKAAEEAIEKHPQEVYIFGAIGSRFDQSMSGIDILTRLASHNIGGYIVDNFNKIHIVRRVQEKFSRDDDFTYISFLPLSTRAVISLHGFVYNGKNILLTRGSTRGLSNQFKNPVASVFVHSGQVLAVQSKD